MSFLAIIGSPRETNGSPPPHTGYPAPRIATPGMSGGSPRHAIDPPVWSDGSHAWQMAPPLPLVASPPPAHTSRHLPNEDGDPTIVSPDVSDNAPASAIHSPEMRGHLRPHISHTPMIAVRSPIRSHRRPHGCDRCPTIEGDVSLRTDASPLLTDASPTLTDASSAWRDHVSASIDGSPALYDAFCRGQTTPQR
jgi:hypothetical protein